jgi:hypothetical protein
MDDAYASAAHRRDRPGDPDEIAAAVDWEATMAFRRRLAAHGFGIAEAMDTAQRFEIGWPAARELIVRCGELDLPAGFVAGAGTDHLEHVRRPADLVDGVLEQIETIRGAGGIAMILPMPWLSRRGCDADTYVETYGAIVRAAGGPLLVHWLGSMFLEDLAGYFPGDSFERVMALDPEAVRGAKLSLLDPERERRVRRALSPRGQIVLTGDDLHFADLIAGPDGAEPTTWTEIGGRPTALGDFSHALLGIFDGIAAPAGLALRLLATGEREAYDEIMTACEALGRIVFEPPVHAYKTGLAFLAWLNGHQPNRLLANHRHLERPPGHLWRVARAAAAAGAITDAGKAAARLGE